MLVTELPETTGRLAVLSDIHGNLPALNAVLQDMEKEGPARLLCLGDYVGYTPFHRRVVGTLRRHGAVMLKGAMDARAAGQGATPEMPGELDDELRSTLAELSLAARLTLDGMEVVAFHGELPDDSPLFREEPRLAAELHAISRYIAEIATLQSDSLFPALAEHFSADAYVFGHTHREGYRRIAGRQFINVPAAGRPRGDVRAGYAILTAKEGELNVELRRVAYDVQAAADAIRAYGLPEQFAEELLDPPE